MDSEEEREGGEDSEKDEGREGRRQWPGALALRAWPHPEPQGSGHTLSTPSSAAAVSHLPPVTSVQQATPEIHEHPAHPWPLPKLITVPRGSSFLQLLSRRPGSGPLLPLWTLPPNSHLWVLTLAGHWPDTADGSQSRSQAVGKSHLLSLFPL